MYKHSSRMIILNDELLKQFSRDKEWENVIITFILYFTGQFSQDKIAGKIIKVIIIGMKENKLAFFTKCW